MVVLLSSKSQVAELCLVQPAACPAVAAGFTVLAPPPDDGSGDPGTSRGAFLPAPPDVMRPAQAVRLGGGHASPDGAEINAADFGVPQVRRRIIIIGSRDGSPIVFPSPTHDRNSYRTFGDAVEGLKGAAEGVKFSDRVLGLIGMIPEGENWHSLPPFLQTAVVGKYKNPSGSILRRCSFSKPLPTLLASGPRQWRTLLAHPVEDRPLNVAEYSRGQGFPDDWKFVGSKGNKYKQIGNAVPIALGEAIGRALIAMNQPTFK